MEYRKDIQGLRAIAVLLVWIFHLNYNFLTGGFIGVDIFFVISGFLITSIILQQKEQDKFSFKNSYWSRIKRIVPAYYVYILIISIATLLVYIPNDALKIRENVFQAIIFNSNVYLSTLDTYFGADSSENPLLQTWTLAIEMKFYFFLPFLVFFLNRKKCFQCFIILCIVLLFYTQYEIVVGNKSLTYFSFFARSPEFLLGAILSLWKIHNKFSIRKQLLMSIIGLLLIFSTAVCFNDQSDYPGFVAMLPCFGTILLIFNKDSYVNTQILSNKVLVYIGELSYSLYLWHWGILALLRYYYVEYTLGVIQYIFSILLTIVLALFSYYLIEKKFKQYSLKKFSSRFGVLATILFLFLLGLKPLYHSFFISKGKLVLPIEEEMLGIETYDKYPTDIIYGDTISDNMLLLLGNSHALNLVTFLDTLGKKEHFAFRSITNTNYPTLPGMKVTSVPEGTYDPQFKSYLNQMKVVYEALKLSDCIIIGMSYIVDSVDLYQSFKDLNLLVDNDKHVILLSDFPTLDRSLRKVAMKTTRPKDREVKYKLTYGKPPQHILNFIVNQSNFHYLDLSDSRAFKDAPYYNDTLMYYDQFHLNTYGSLVYEKYSGEKLAKLIRELRNR